ncbi:MAG: response regulator transcription factor [Chloroflexota bacterium]|nr:response regulator transcription factor [Chloroflexota bacterium]PLS82552.1 MAG: DNA-binding response regulator [Chloroflexota bacterium]
MYRTINILIVDDHPLFRQGVRYSLQEEHDLKVVGDAASAEEALQFVSVTPPDVMLVDLNLPGIDGLELTRQIHRTYPSLGVVMLSMHESDEQAFNALRAGAAAYYSKEISSVQLAQIIRRVARGEYVINEVMFDEPKVAQRILSQFRDLNRGVTTEADVDFSLFSPLSDREIEVLERIASGSANKEIADTLSISTQTVKNHISSILRKLSLNDRTQAVIYALRRGWIDTPLDTATPMFRMAVLQEDEE